MPEEKKEFKWEKSDRFHIWWIEAPPEVSKLDEHMVRIEYILNDEWLISILGGIAKSRIPGGILEHERIQQTAVSILVTVVDAIVGSTEGIKDTAANAGRSL